MASPKPAKAYTGNEARNSKVFPHVYFLFNIYIYVFVGNKFI